MDTILCEKPDHAEMPKHYHMAGEYEARLQRLEAFKARVTKALDGLPVGFMPDALEAEIDAAAKEVDA